MVPIRYLFKPAGPFDGQVLQEFLRSRFEDRQPHHGQGKEAGEKT